MFIQSGTLELEQQRHSARSLDPLAVQSHQRSGVFRFTIFILVLLGCLTACIATVVAGVRATPVRPIVDPPLYLLPGSPLPAGARCGPTLDGSTDLDCHIYLTGKDVLLGTRHSLIAVTALSAPDDPLGDLILAWGTPSNFVHSGRVFQVFWGTKYAYLITCPFQPNGRVAFIVFGFIERSGEAWHGFTGSKDCS